MTACYDRLLRLASVVTAVCDPAAPNDEMAAHRTVRRLTLRRVREGTPDETYGALRRRLLGPNGGLYVKRTARVPSWLRSPDAGSTVAATASLLPPPLRAAYVLGVYEDLDEEEVLGELLACGYDDPPRDTVRQAVEAVESATGQGPRQQRSELERLAVPQDRAPLSPRPGWRRRRRLRTAVIVVALAVLAVAAVVYRDQEADVHGGIRTVERAASQDDLENWATRGGRAGDGKLLRRARAAWARHGNTRDRLPGQQRVTIAYAGEVDGRTIVLMHNASRAQAGPRTSAAVYTDRPSKGVDVYPLRLDVLGEHAFTLTGGDAPRYLFPPGTSSAEVSFVDAAIPHWRPVRIRDGISDPVRAPAGQGCGAGVVIRDLSQGVAYLNPGTRTAGYPLTEVEGSLRDSRQPGFDTAMGAAGIFTALRAGLCGRAGIRFWHGVHNFEINREWHGRLPDGSGDAAFVTVEILREGESEGRGETVSWLVGEGTPAIRRRLRSLLPPGHPAIGLSSPPERVVATASPGIHEDLGPSRGGSAWAAWWKGTSGRWNLIVTGTSKVAKIRVTGRVPDRTVRGNLLMLRGGDGATPPNVIVNAYDADGNPLPVDQRIHR